MADGGKEIRWCNLDATLVVEALRSRIMSWPQAVEYNMITNKQIRIVIHTQVQYIHFYTLASIQMSPGVHIYLGTILKDSCNSVASGRMYKAKDFSRAVSGDSGPDSRGGATTVRSSSMEGTGVNV
ncbi:hypothetical protein BDD12DRAFT_800769 [Trichophaea hybrida]|nr:hypothetical protein BDD12DRAFT_800769 [Trichophaea hybrida]